MSGRRRVDTLSPQLAGRWLVVTLGSQHHWDLDAMTYTRIPGRLSLSGSFRFDRVPMAISWVDRWPQFGSTSLVWLYDPDQHDGVEHWRLSSRIISISEMLPDE
ncbi:hypothetical protein [Mycobacterium sp.]|uniref:hypothetical protein n=1 Tax=Mycobacterium sp. TaxID=1785 RepID=UPI0025D13A99|nr:hypothetical protein [Mycobacterium sp.]